MKMRNLTKAIVFAFAGLTVGANAYAMQKPLTLFGNLGYYYTLSKTDGGAKGESTYAVGSVNADSYIWRPWFSTLNVGTTASTSVSRFDNANNTNNTYLLSSRADFSLLPRSRMPLTLTYYSNNNLKAEDDSTTFMDVVGYGFKTRYFSAKQSFIGRGGDQLDLWYNNRMRGAADIGDLTDNTVGAKIKSRFANHNFYATSSYQARESSFTDNKTKVLSITAMHNYVPNSQFYIKTLGSHTNYKNKTDSTNGSFIANNTSSTNQVSSFFYWRPVYRPYVFNGAVRLHQRQLTNNITDDINDNAGVNASVNGTYNLNRRTQLTASVNGFALDTDRATTLSTNQSILLMYQSDAVLYRSTSYRWFSNAGIGNDISMDDYKNDDKGRQNDLSQNFNVGLGHSAHKRWITGNRSTARASLTQQVREYFATEAYDSVLTLSHTGSMSWNLEPRTGGGAYVQASAIDTRSFFDNSLEMQIINFQLSRSMPLSRLSAWSGNLSLQSTRREDGSSGKSFFEGFLNVATGRLSYQHGRLFGIYKLKFRTKLDLSATMNRAGGDRKQLDGEIRLGYNIGKLATALVGRIVESDSGLGSKSLIFQLNRTF